MASKSRAAQEKLAELEKDSTPFEDQLVEAAKFIKVDLDDDRRFVAQNLDEGEERKDPTYHGREEWLLRWLLKRLQAPNDDVPRQTPRSWILFCHLIRMVPLQNVARMLIERKFMSILRQALEEANKAASSGEISMNTPDAGSGNKGKPHKVSKKRRRSGELVETISDSRNNAQRLPAATFAAIQQIIRFTKATSEISGGGRTTTFSMECMKSAIRATAEDAAKILGSWLSLCHISSKGQSDLDMAYMRAWLSPFIEVWEYRILGPDDLMQFSFFCSQPLLSLLKATKTGAATADWKDEMEQLIARNIMIPAKAALADSTDSKLLNTLTRVSVIEDSANAAMLFEVAVRSLQAQASRRRRPADEAWIQTVFATLREAMPPQRAKGNGRAVREMLQSSIQFRVNLELSTLRSVTMEYCFQESNTNWALLATIIKLDANVFLIANEEDLLQELLTRITAASLDPAWADISEQVVSDVLVPLMDGFAKARDLSAFIRHWYTNLVEVRRLHNEAKKFTMARFSAWEDENLQIEFSKIMEASLTVTQVTQLLDWLSSEVTQNPDAVCVLLDAIAGSITHEEVVDVVGLRLFHIMFDGGALERLDEGCKWRSWRIISQTLTWLNPAGLAELSFLWEENVMSTDSLTAKFGEGSRNGISDGTQLNLEALEVLRCACAAWHISEKEAQLEIAIKKPLIKLLNSVAQHIESLMEYLCGNREMDGSKCGLTSNTLYPGFGWILWSFGRCVLVEFPRVFELGNEMNGGTFRDLLQRIFWIASVFQNDSSTRLNPWLHTNSESFRDIWMAMLNDDQVLNNRALIAEIIDIALCEASNAANPLVKTPTTNKLAVQSLLQLPLEVFSRKDRERVMKSWLPTAEDASFGVSVLPTIIDIPVLSLKVKIMGVATVYDGMKYGDLKNLADALAAADIQNMNVYLALFKELAKRTISHVAANLDQPRNREYTLDAIHHLKKKTKAKSDSSKTHKLSFAAVALFEILLNVFTTRGNQLNDLAIFTTVDFASVKKSFKARLLAQLEELLAKTKSSKKSDKRAEKSLAILSTIDALSSLKVTCSDVAKLVNAVESFTASLDDADLKMRLDTFMCVRSGFAKAATVISQPGGNVSTLYGRQASSEKVHALIAGRDQAEKLELIKNTFGNDLTGLTLDSLWAVRHVLMACEDSRQSSDEDDEADVFDLSTVYSKLCSNLWKVATVRQFSLSSEIMAAMLRTKGHAMNQWNIDSTLGCIIIMCSRNSGKLRSTRAGTVYNHLCQIFQTLLTSHRLKLEGHFHLVVQAMQSLLRCLFTPLPHSTSKPSKLFAPPSWLSSSKHQLNASHAAGFTRLVTLICDPTVSSVTRSKHNNLTSATDKAKRMAGQHMQYVLMLYVQLQLEMKMLPEIREKMIPGLYAIFDTTTLEMRRMIGDSLDSSGRALFGTLIRDYQRFGKWKGS